MDGAGDVAAGNKGRIIGLAPVEACGADIDEDEGLAVFVGLDIGPVDVADRAVAEGDFEDLVVVDGPDGVAVASRGYEGVENLGSDVAARELDGLKLETLGGRYGEGLIGSPIEGDDTRRRDDAS